MKISVIGAHHHLKILWQKMKKSSTKTYILHFYLFIEKFFTNKLKLLHRKDFLQESQTKCNLTVTDFKI